MKRPCRVPTWSLAHAGTAQTALARKKFFLQTNANGDDAVP